MLVHGLSLAFLLPSLALYTAIPTHAAPSALAAPEDLAAREASSSALVRRRELVRSEYDGFATTLQRRDGEHAHSSHHGAPLTMLNETEILLYHAPTPPSYWSIDFEDHDSGNKRYPGLMMMHVLMMSAAFFGALPAAIALRSVKHAWHGFSMILFWVFVVLGCSASGLYRKLTPDMYEGQKHSSQGYFVIFLALVVSAVDLISAFGRLVGYAQGLRNGDTFALRTFWKVVILGQQEHQALGVGAEYANLVEDSEELEEDMKAHLHDDGSHTDGDETAQWANNVRHHDYAETPVSERTLFGHRSRGSQHSDDTLHEHKRIVPAKESLLRRTGNIAFGTLERGLVFAGFAQFLFGVAVYTGGCRENYVNGCLAHLIKGGIFWCYGLVTFARFLGSFSEKGWAWNRAPVGEHVSAEFTESAVIFFYGITNTWMERFGAAPGDPYTTKEIQHISIAVMFWFAGLVGMGLESRRLRRWLAAVSTASMKSANEDSEIVAEPASYGGSFNPFPALVIGVTGAAMSAHAQTYLFQVQIHALWGYCLTAFAVLRCLSYFFVWLSPPRSILPSRPPTEALASFFLACGGLVFVLSDEEVTYAAMRKGRDDVMMFLNLAVAVTCLAFVWTLCVVSFKGWLKSRTHAAVAFHPSA
ncbi:hypothetical protein BV25DRAFT_63309 [Artomyces pyxidatus]|uniref:Uncharacterized protein n=1 Tax=Artomyces pyxidatus TaxID=48021 RepID=A0ACB8TKM5_9AGAM|nr:hypothetical protein BV25DRAFT_63309 [Artomyces pyxidatus]